MSMRSLKRQFFKSADGTCDGTSMEEDNSFILPFDDCVGPFGPPRPWGKFTLLLETAEYYSKEEEQDNDTIALLVSLE